MAYSFVNSQGQTYYLHEYDAQLKGGRVYRNYFFAKSLSPKGRPIEELPSHRNRVVENVRTHMPVLARTLPAPASLGSQLVPQLAAN